MRLILKQLLIVSIPMILLSADIFSQQSRPNKTIVFEGQVKNKKTGKGIGFAALMIDELSQGIACNAGGHFRLPHIKPGRYKVEISCLNYIPTTVDIVLDNDTSVVFWLQEQSYTLSGVEVMATFRPSKGSNAIIGQTALEYIQPVSIADVFLLLPGNVIGGNSMHQFNLTTSRQVGSDKNTSLGMGLIADGIPITNDATRSQLYGVSGDDNVDRTVYRRGAINAGIDMRNISTDHIESIEIIRGISSAQDGNLSSGAIHINSRKGVTPWRIRAKADPLNKLIYVGKGFKLSDKAGSLHIGIDGLSSTPDVRERLESFVRATMQANYTNQILTFDDKPLDISIKWSGTSSINSVKSDELVEENDEYYISNYFRTMLSATGKWQLNMPLISSIELTGSADITRDVLDRHKMVLSSMGPMSMPISTEPGEHEGIFLPVKYYSDYKIENIPLYFFARINLNSIFYTGKKLNHNIIYGAEIKSNKNIGTGAIVDPQRPPYPGNNTFIRPRPNYTIPAIVNGAVYLEDKATLEVSRKAKADIRFGVRATHMFNLPSDYVLSHKLLIEPRLQAGFTIKSHTEGGVPVSNTFRIGYGEENKLPTLDMLYPDKLYRDFVVLNAYYQQPDRDHLIVNTYIHNPINPLLTENKNRKIEIGWDFVYNGFEASISGFSEESKGGFSYFSEYYPIGFMRYVNLKHTVVSGRPTKDDYNEEYYRDFSIFPTVHNSEKTIKRGLEYRIKTPMIKAISTNVELNGAYYLTVYTQGIPVMYRPDVKELGQKYPYVGIYDGDTYIYRSRFNTNIWVNTHIKKFGIIFTNFVQIVWFSTVRNGNEEDVLPSKYIDLDGNIHEVDKAALATTDGILRYLRRERSELYYRTTTKPVSIFMNLKASKEFGKNVKLSFFINNLIDINPYYKAADKTTEREWAIPFFGAELTVNL